MEKEKNEMQVSPKRFNLFKWLFFASLAGLLILLYANYQSGKETEMQFQSKFRELNGRIESLESDKSRLENEVNSKDKSLQGYASFLPLINNMKLVDTAYKSLPFRYGQRVLILPDSAPGIINSIALTANELEYSVRYLVRNKKGELVSLSVSDIKLAE